MNAVSTDVVDARVSGLTRYSGDPAGTDLSAVHAAAFIAPDLLLTQPPSSCPTSGQRNRTLHSPINQVVPPAAAAMDNYRNASRPAAHAATFEHPIGVGSLTDPDIFEDP